MLQKKTSFRNNGKQRKSNDSIRRTKPPLLMFSQRNNPYCELLQISAAKIQFFSKPHKLFKVFLYLWQLKE